jgi:hypothetical protein
MSRLRILLFRLRALFRSRQMDRDLDDEIAGHLAEATDCISHPFRSWKPFRT